MSKKKLKKKKFNLDTLSSNTRKVAKEMRVTLAPNWELIAMNIRDTAKRFGGYDPDEELEKLFK